MADIDTKTAAPVAAKHRDSWLWSALHATIALAHRLGLTLEEVEAKFKSVIAAVKVEIEADEQKIKHLGEDEG